MDAAVIFLEDGFPEHHKTAQAGGDAAWLFVCGLGWLKRSQSTTGLIPKAMVPQLSDRKNPNKLAMRLVEVGYWHDHGGDGFLVHEYVEHNAKAIATSQARREAANHRWRKPPSDANASGLHAVSSANGDAGSVQDPSMSQVTSTSPIPHPTKPPPQSSSAPRPQAGKDDPRLWPTVEVIVDRRRRERRGGDPIKNLGKWKIKVAGDVYDEHATEARALLAADPDLTPEQLASRLEGSPVATIKPYEDPKWDEHVPAPREHVQAALSEARAVGR